MGAGVLRSRAFGRETEMVAVAVPVFGQGRGVPGAANQQRWATARRYSAYVGGRFGRAPLDAKYFKKASQRRRHDDAQGHDRRERGTAKVQEACQRDCRGAEGFLTVPTPRSLMPDARRDRHGDDQARNDRCVERGADRGTDHFCAESDGCIQRSGKYSVRQGFKTAEGQQRAHDLRHSSIGGISASQEGTSARNAIWVPIGSPVTRKFGLVPAAVEPPARKCRTFEAVVLDLAMDHVKQRLNFECQSSLRFRRRAAIALLINASVCGLVAAIIIAVPRFFMPGGATGRCSNGSPIDRSTRASSDIVGEFSGFEFGSLDIV